MTTPRRHVIHASELSDIPADVLRKLRALPVLGIGDPISPRRVVHFAVVDLDGSPPRVAAIALGFRPEVSALVRADSAYLGWLVNHDGTTEPSEFAISSVTLKGVPTLLALDVAELDDGAERGGEDAPRRFVRAYFLGAGKLASATRLPSGHLSFRVLEAVN